MSNFTLVWHFLIFGVLPYVVIAVLVVGSLLRFILAPYSWKSQSSEILDKKIFLGCKSFPHRCDLSILRSLFRVVYTDSVAKCSQSNAQTPPMDGNHRRRSLRRTCHCRSSASDMAPPIQRTRKDGIPPERFLGLVPPAGGHHSRNLLRCKFLLY